MDMRITLIDWYGDHIQGRFFVHKYLRGCCIYQVYVHKLDTCMFVRIVARFRGPYSMFVLASVDIEVYVTAECYTTHTR